MQSKRKHILFLTSWYPDRVLRDNGDFIQRHAQAVALQNEVTVVHAIKDPQQSSGKYEVELKEYKGVKEIIVYFKPFFFRPLNLLFLIQAYLIGLQHVQKVDIIHLNVIYPAGLIGLYLKNKLKRPLILTEHWTQLHVNRFKSLPFYKRMAIRRILDHVDLVLPVSEHLGKSIRKINSSISFKVIPNVVDFDQFSHKRRHPKGIIRFLHLSHLGDEHKNVSGMLRVAKRLVDDGFQFEFHIGGNGDLAPIHHFIAQHQLQDYIYPFERLAHDEVKAKMQASSCFVLFSRYENQPCVQAEAFACGLPIIATKVGGIQEFFPDDFGILIESEAENQLYDAMKSVIEGKDFATTDQMHTYAKQQFSRESISRQFNLVYDHLISSPTHVS